MEILANGKNCEYLIKSGKFSAAFMAKFCLWLNNGYEKNKNVYYICRVQIIYDNIKDSIDRNPDKTIGSSIAVGEQCITIIQGNYGGSDLEDIYTEAAGQKIISGSAPCSRFRASMVSSAPVHTYTLKILKFIQLPTLLQH